MKPFFLVETTTKDKFIHQGIFFRPSSRRGGTSVGKATRALLWIHGLTSNFYGHIKLFEEFAVSCDAVGFGFAAFNNRGHDMITGLSKLDRRKPKGRVHAIGGAGMENFTDCVYDIEAGIDFLVNQGFSQVVVIGESTGANKVCYYAAIKRTEALVGVVLASPLSDRLSSGMELERKRNLIYMQNLVNQGKADELIAGYHFFPLTPKRYLSLLTPNSLEDQFDYGDFRPRMKYYSKIKKPLLVIFGEQDEYADRSVHKIRAVFDSFQQSTNYKSVVIPGAFHSYDGKEKQLTACIVSWVKSL